MNADHFIEAVLLFVQRVCDDVELCPALAKLNLLHRRSTEHQFPVHTGSSCHKDNLLLNNEKSCIDVKESR